MAPIGPNQPTDEHSPRPIDRPTSHSRRTILKAAGASTAGLAAMTGTASAHEDFRGCSQVCTDREHQAVIATVDGYRCELITEPSDRNNPAARKLRDNSPQNTVRCLEVGSGEAIIGICSDARGFVPNPGRCARNYVPDRDMERFAANFSCETCSIDD